MTPASNVAEPAVPAPEETSPTRVVPQPGTAVEAKPKVEETPPEVAPAVEEQQKGGDKEMDRIHGHQGPHSRSDRVNFIREAWAIHPRLPSTVKFQKLSQDGGVEIL